VVQGLLDQDLQLFERLEAGIVLVDAAGIVVRWNSNAERILGLATDDALGRPWTEFMTVVRDDGIGGHEVRLNAGKAGSWHGLTMLRVGEGEEVCVRALVQPYLASPTDDRPGTAAVFWAEVSEVGRTSPTPAGLPYRDLFRRSSEALLLVDMDGLVADANEAAAELIGWQREEMVGHSLLPALKGWTTVDTQSAQHELEKAGSIVRELTVSRRDGIRIQVEATCTMVAPTDGGFALIRLRDLTTTHLQTKMLREMGSLARITGEPMEIAAVARQVVAVVAEGLHADASIIVLQGREGFTVVAGPETSEAIRASFSGLDPADSPLAHRIREAEKPFEIDLDGERGKSVWAERIRALGLCELRATPLWFAEDRIGAIVLLWNSEPDRSFDTGLLEQLGRHAGLVIGNAGLRDAARRDSAVRAALEGAARVGGVVLAQIADAIAATDGDGRITALNPAAESMYGLRADDSIGRPMDEVIEQLDLDGSPIRPEVMETVASGYWRGRVVHRPLIGTRAGQHMLVDLSLTAIHDDRRRPAGMIAISRPAAPGVDAEAAAVALGSLAAATSRARTKHEVAAAALERLCEATAADSGIIATWADGDQIIEASRGFGEDLLTSFRTSSVPAMRQALERTGRIIAIETIGSFPGGQETAQALVRQGLTTGFVVDLRARDESIGFLALASHAPGWARPADEVVLQVAGQTANALETARLMERLERGLAQERLLTSQLETLMGLTLLPQHDITEEGIAQLLLERIVAALGADGGFVVREAADRLKVVASCHIPDSLAAATESQPASSLGFWQRLITEPGRGAYHERTATSGPAGITEQLMGGRGVTSNAVFPIREGDRLLGAFWCYFSGSAGAADVDERNVEAVGRIISIAYANVRMREGLAEAAEHERRLTAELRALQELTLLGATTDDLRRLAQETIEEVVVATGASGGGYILIEPENARVDPVTWVGRASKCWATFNESSQLPADWPPMSQLLADSGIWLSHSDLSDEEAGAQAVLPLRVDNRLAGVLHLEWIDRPRGEQFDVHFLEPIARICSISLANFRLRSELLRRAATQRALGHRLDTLDELTRIGEEASSFEELAHRTVSLVREALGAGGVCYLLIEPGHQFETHAVAGETGDFRTWLKGVPAKDAPGGSLLLSGASSVLADFVAANVNERVLPLAAATGFRSFGAIPIRTGDELAGALLCFFEQSVATLTLDEAALDSVARIAGIALANFRLRERLVSSEERYRTLFEESPDALLVSALDGTILDANEAAVRLYRVNRGEVLGRYLGQFINADEREMAGRRQLVWAQGRGTFRDRGRRSDGSEFPIEMEVRVVDLGGQRRFLHLVRDLSDQDRLQRELLQAQKMEAIGQLVSGVAHELNNPLAAIIAFSQLMRSDPRLPDDMKHDAGLLVQEADRTRRIVQNLLDFARARPPERRPTSIGVLVNSVLELQSYALSANQIQVKLEIPETLPPVDLDRAQLQQVLLNLTINAIQAVRSRDRKAPAHLWVSATLVKTRPATGAAKADRPADEPQRVRLTVRDDGPGVPESARARLFDPFFTTKQPGEGTGLGLSVSFGIVAAHDGHLWYEPGPGGSGSSFVIELPVTARNSESQQFALQPAAEPPLTRSTSRSAPSPRSRKETSGTEQPATAPASPNPWEGAPEKSGIPVPGGASAASGPGPDSGPRRPRVLALDDEPSIRAFLRKALTAAGLECVPYQDGAEALEGVRESEFDVMLIDHKMAGMNGTEFYDAAVEIRPELARRAVFMSGDVLNPDLRGFATQRDVRLLAKPFDIEAVIRVVREAMTAADQEAGVSGSSI
jgi:PAS domain S-box-containing protein